MERTRQWIHTLALVAIGAAALIVAVGTVLPARAAEPPTCTTLTTRPMVIPKASDEINAMALAAIGIGHEHAVVIPVGENGLITSVLCVW